MTYAKATAILAKPEAYSRRDVDKARALLRDAARNAKRQARTLPDD